MSPVTGAQLLAEPRRRGSRCARISSWACSREPPGPSPEAALLLQRLREMADEAPDDMAACLIQTTSAATDSMRLEEIELDGRQLTVGRGERFLAACAVAPGDMGPALKKAQGIAGE